MQIILSVSIAVLAGLLMTRVVKSLKLPDVTAYLTAGIFVGPYFLGSLGIDGLGFISMEAVDLMTLVSQVALGFIAFAIGNEFRLEEITHIGRQAVVVGVFQGLAAMLCVDTALLLLHILIPDKLSVAQAITLGAISTATAPAATLMVVRQYKASGPLTDLLLPVVALDDAVGLVAFAISFGIARTLSSGVVDFVSILVDPLIEIAASLLLGAVSGWLLTQLKAFPFQYEPAESDDCVCIPHGCPFHDQVLHWAGSCGLLLPAGLHDAGDRFLQPLPLIRGLDGKGGSLDLAVIRTLFCGQRRRA